MKLDDNKIELKINDLNNGYYESNNELIDLEQKISSLKKNLSDANINKNNKEIEYGKELDIFNDLKIKLNKFEVSIDNLNFSISNAQNRLVENYKLTIENAIETYQDQEIEMSESDARFRIENLKIDIQKYGDINLNALTDYEEKKQNMMLILLNMKIVEKLLMKLVAQFMN